jgi:cytochrome c oxidase assembly protein subunit 15
LSAFGFDSTAEQILQDKSIREEEDFNPVKTWIEYINRIIGVIIGFLIFAVFAFSLTYWKTNRPLTILSFLSFVLVGFQGWIGSIVVSTNLTPWTVTIHMVLALVIVALIILILHKIRQAETVASYSPLQVSVLVKMLLILSMIVLLVQILFGTQVREAIDSVASVISDRQEWITATGTSFIVHRSFSWIVLILNALLVAKLWKTGVQNRFTLSVILLILGTVLTGAGMALFSIPSFLQPVHLLLATATFGVEFLLVLKVNSSMVIVLK